MVGVRDDQIHTHDFLESWGPPSPFLPSPTPGYSSSIVNLPETYPSESELLTRTDFLIMAPATIRQHSGDCQTSWLVLNRLKDTSTLA